MQLQTCGNAILILILNNENLQVLNVFAIMCINVLFFFIYSEIEIHDIFNTAVVD